MLRPGLLMNPDNLRRPRRIPRLNFGAGPHPLTADDQRILVAQLVADPGERFLHGMRVVVLREVGKRLVAERALRRTGQDDGGLFKSSHNKPSLVQFGEHPNLRIALTRLQCNSFRLSRGHPAAHPIMPSNVLRVAPLVIRTAVSAEAAFARMKQDQGFQPRPPTGTGSDGGCRWPIPHLL